MSPPNPGRRCQRCGEPIPTRVNWEALLYLFIAVVGAFIIGFQL